MRLLFAVFAVLLFGAGTVFAGEEAPKRNGPKDYWALVVGIADYRYPESGLEKLKYAEKDADAVERMLLAQGWNPERVHKLTGRDATRRNLEDQVNGWLRRVGPEDMLLIYWAGHGYPDLADQRRVYFACYDTDMKKPWTGYRMDKVVNTVREHGIRNVVFIADTCHAGKIATRSDGTKGLSIKPFLENVPRNADVPEGWIFMAATEAGRPTVENDRWRNGVFTYCLLRAMEGAAATGKYGVIDMGTLRDYLREQVPLESKKVSDIELRPVIVTSSPNSDIWNLTLRIK